MRTTLSTLAFLGCTLSASLSAVADQDDSTSLPSVEDTNYQPEVFSVSKTRSKDCARVGKACFFGRGDTLAGFNVDPTVGIVTTLAHGTKLASLYDMRPTGEPAFWQAELVARLKSRTTAEPIIVAILDYADPEGMARKEATAVWQVTSSPVQDLGMRFVFSSDNGFQSNHTYLLRVVQGVGAKERILAEGNFLLE